MQKHILSKSTFIRGVQCEKSLYLNKHARNLRFDKKGLSTLQFGFTIRNLRVHY